MQIQPKYRWFVPVVVTSLIVFLILLSGYLILPDKIAHRLVERLSDESGVEIIPVQARYSFLSGELVLEYSDLNLTQGVQVTADELRLHIKLSQLWSDQLTLNDLYLKNPYFNIDLDRIANGTAVGMTPLQKYLTENVNTFELGAGGLYFHSAGPSTSPPLAVKLVYRSMQIRADNNSELTFSIEGLLSSGAWSLQGALELESKTMTGALDLRNIPLESLMDMLPDNKMNEWEQATVSASQRVSWSPENGFSLEGSAGIHDGVWTTDDRYMARWQELDFYGLTVNSKGFSVVRALLNNADVLLDEQALSLLPSQLVAFEEIELKNVNVFTDPEAWKEGQPKGDLVDLNGQLTKWDVASRTLKATAYAYGLVPLALEARFDAEGQGQARLNIRGLDVGKQSKRTRKVAGYDLSGSQLNASLQLLWQKEARKAKGQVTFTHFVVNRDDDSALDWNVPLIKAAMMDNKGRIIVPILEQSLSGRSLFIELVTLFHESIQERFEYVSESPYDYLSNLSGGDELLVNTVEYVPGQSIFCQDSEDALNQWISVLNRRPALDLSFQGQASREIDRAYLAQVELDRDLLELYTVIKKKKQDDVTKIPTETRLKLVEQMYLRLHKRKLPDIGNETQKQRVTNAENWLLANWPVKSENLQALAEQRSENIKACMVDAGLSANRLHLEPAQTVDGQTQMQFRLLY